MKGEENEFSTDGLLYHCNNPGQSSHESIDSGCCDAEVLIGSCQKQPFSTFKRVPAPSQPHNSPSQNLSSYPAPNRNISIKQRGSVRKEENATSNGIKEGIQSESSGPSYKYLTWREKDRRRRFREEWKHLWLVVPHGMYEVSNPNNRHLQYNPHFCQHFYHKMVGILTNFPPLDAESESY